MTLRLAAAVAVVVTLVAAAPAALDAVLGRAIFERIWVGGGSSTKAADGLGPLHNARSCAGCHIKGGPAAIMAGPEGTVTGAGLVARLASADGAPDPVYGHQIQTRGLIGHKAEARTAFRPVAAVPGEAGPRMSVELTDFGYGPLDPKTHVGMRQAPALAGRAAFDRVDVAAVIARGEANRAAGGEVRGRARIVAGPDGEPTLGRYGWKAGGTDLAGQVASAFSIDLGLSTTRLRNPAGECTPAQQTCLNALHGDNDGVTETEITDQMIDLLGHYLVALRPPAPSGDERGPALFAATGCSACHVPRLPAAGGGEIAAYTDLLLHDLGPGLADASTDPGVAPAEWRTAPLMALSAGRSGQRRYLHDARAGSLEEAILWHDGEAAGARTRFEALPDSDRAALITFLNRL